MSEAGAGAHNATTKGATSSEALVIIIPPLVLQAAQLLLGTRHHTATTRGQRARARAAVPYATAEIVVAGVHWRGRVPILFSRTFSCRHYECV